MHSLVQVVCVLIYLQPMRVWIEVSEDVLQLPIVLNTWNFLLLTSFLHGQDEYFEKYFIADKESLPVQPGSWGWTQSQSKSTRSISKIGRS